MNFFNLVLEYGSQGVIAFGGAIAISGLFAFGEGKSHANAGRQEEGMTKIVGGGIIMAVGATLVPQLADLLVNIG